MLETENKDYSFCIPLVYHIKYFKINFKAFDCFSKSIKKCSESIKKLTNSPIFKKRMAAIAENSTKHAFATGGIVGDKPTAIINQGERILPIAQNYKTMQNLKLLIGNDKTPLNKE